MNAALRSAMGMTDQRPPEGIQIVNPHLQFPKASLLSPKPAGYVVIAAEIDRVWPFRLGPDSQAKRESIERSVELATQLEHLNSVVVARVFLAHLIPPAVGSRMDQGERRRVHVARFDLVVLIETRNLGAAVNLQDQSLYMELMDMLRVRARYLHVVRARNERRLGDVDHNRNGIFLFNFFHADEFKKLIPTWEYTAGWFEAKTGLDNSEVLVPVEGEQSQYGIINHCRWDRWRDILPDLVFRSTFYSYVMGNFDANGVVPMPILYRLAPGSRVSARGTAHRS